MHVIETRSEKHGKKFDSQQCRQWLAENVDIDFFRTICDPVRSELLIFLASSGELTVGEIAEHFPQNRSVISRYLDQMHRLGAVERRKVGREILYQANSRLIVDKFEEATTHMKAVLKN